MDTTKKATIKNVNKVLELAGREERVCQGKGYFYFHGGDAESWFTSSVPVCKLSMCSLSKVIQIFNEMAGTSIKA